MPKQTKAQILEEALALEKAGARWQIKHAAAFLNRSESFVRNCDCPKHAEEPGPRSVKGRGRTTLEPAEVRKWDAERVHRMEKVA